jgi:hypothetical protein
LSQAGIISTAGGGGSGTPIETLTGNTGGAVPPTANNINLVGGTSTANNNTGITIAGNQGTSTETVTLTNRAIGTLTTTNLVPGNLLTFPLGATPGTYLFHLEIAGYNTSSALSAAYSVSGLTVRTTGAAGTIIGLPSIDTNEEGLMVGVDVNITTPANTLSIDVTGIAASVIDWNMLLTYLFVS